MGGDPDQITEEMRPVNTQSFGLIYTSPLMLLTHRLTTVEFSKSKWSPSYTVSFIPSLRKKRYNRKMAGFCHKYALIIVDCLGSLH